MSNETKNESDFEIFQNASLKKIKEYFMREKRLADIRQLENSPDRGISPELSESFELYLQERKKKAEMEKLKLRNNCVDVREQEEKTVTDATLIDEDSFLDLEKMCENTLHLNNVSEILTDLTTLEADTNKKKKSLNFANETHLTEVEAPSFLYNSSIMSPNKNSPLKALHENRPSTILEMTENSISNKTSSSSYRTAVTSGTDKSEYYQTANDESVISLHESLKRPTSRRFYNETIDFTKDSLDQTEDVRGKTSEITVDSLNIETSEVNSSSGIDSSYDEKMLDESKENVRINDTLEEFEMMLAQAQKMQEEKAKTPKFIKEVLTPKSANKSPASVTPKTARPSPTPWSATKPHNTLKTTPGVALKNSPLIKFSPAANKSPATNFKLPKQPTSTSKIPQFSSANSKKFQHIVSPISRYINHTPELPLASNAHIQYGVGQYKQYNFRDSESFVQQNTGSANKVASLPLKAKTKSTVVKEIFNQRSTSKIPGGDKMRNLLTNSSPTVTVHKEIQLKSQSRARVFQNNTLNDTAFSEQSFADLSLISGDISIHAVEGVKRIK